MMEKMRFLGIAALVTLIGLVGVSLATQNEAQQRMNSIVAEIPQNWWEARWDKRAELKDFIASYPSEMALCAQAQYLLAGSYYVQGEYNQAISEYQRIISSYPQAERECAKAQFEIGQIYFYQLKDLPMANSAYQSVLNRYSDSFIAPTAHLMLARCLQGQDRVEEALVEYQKVAVTYTAAPLQQAMAHRDMANLLIEKKQDFTKAISHLKQAYLLCPLDEEATRLLQFIFSDIYRGFKLLDNSLHRANLFIAYQRYGAAGPDQVVGTGDDGVDVLAQF